MKYHFTIHKEAKGYWGECVELKGCSSQAETKEKLIMNLENALNLYLSEPEDSNVLFPSPKKRLNGRNRVAIEADPSVAAAVAIRQFRVRMKLTQLKMKEILGINHLSSYQRLEDPRRSNPEFKTLNKIKKIFPNFKLDEI